VKNNLEQTSHMDDEILEKIRPEPLLIELVNNKIYPEEPNKKRVIGV
jgi:hypothetical protein